MRVKKDGYVKRRGKEKKRIRRMGFKRILISLRELPLLFPLRYNKKERIFILSFFILNNMNQFLLIKNRKCFNSVNRIAFSILLGLEVIRLRSTSSWAMQN